MKALERLFVDTKLVVHVLVCVFAISSWVDINGLWVELPILVTNLPEQWTLPSYIIALSQVANVGPIIFFVLANYVGKTRDYKTTLDKVTSYAIMLVGFTSTLLLAFLWRKTANVGGAEHSIALMALSFCLAVMDCTSSVAYFAFLAALKPSYMPSFFLGEGLSGLIPALLALGQGAGDIVCVNGSQTAEQIVNGTVVNGSVDVNVTEYSVYPVYLPPRFSVQVFFLLLSCIIGLSVLSFTLINYWGYCKDQFVNQSFYSISDGDSSTHNIHEKQQHADYLQGLRYTDAASTRSQSDSSSKYQSQPDSNRAYVSDSSRRDLLSQNDRRVGNGASRLLIQPGSNGFSSGQDNHGFRPDSRGSKDVVSTRNSKGGKGEGEAELLAGKGEKRVGKGEVTFLLFQVVVVNFLITSFLLSIQVYSSLPYGISTYNLVVTLTNIANPVACSIAIFVTVKSSYVITAMTSLGVGCGAYIIVVATMSPTPPLAGTVAGGAIAVIIWVGASFFLTLGKISVAGVMRVLGRRALIWYGAATQTGALVGALTGFVLVNQIKLFKDAPWC